MDGREFGGNCFCNRILCRDELLDCVGMSSCEDEVPLCRSTCCGYVYMMCIGYLEGVVDGAADGMGGWVIGDIISIDVYYYTWAGRCSGVVGIWIGHGACVCEIL